LLSRSFKEQKKKNKRQKKMQKRKRKRPHRKRKRRKKQRLKRQQAIDERILMAFKCIRLCNLKSLFRVVK
jgi:hypothetical protein